MTALTYQQQLNRINEINNLLEQDLTPEQLRALYPLIRERNLLIDATEDYENQQDEAQPGIDEVPDYEELEEEEDELEEGPLTKDFINIYDEPLPDRYSEEWREIDYSNRFTPEIDREVAEARYNRPEHLREETYINRIEENIYS
jgi:hypothetical protein